MLVSPAPRTSLVLGKILGSATLGWIQGLMLLIFAPLAGVSIGVADIKRAKEFYKDGLGLPVKKAYGNKFVMFSGTDGTSDLGMYKREALADDAAVAPEGSGFHGFSITHAVDSAEQVDALLGRAVAAGGQIVSAGAANDGRGYFGCFADLDGNVWQLATRV